MRIFRFSSSEDVRRIMYEIGADPYGIKIMLPKATAFLIRLKAVNNVAANILKQEMLALGADAAVARGSLTGSIKKTDILLIGQLAQFNALVSKLKIQPFGLQKLAEDLDRNIKKFIQTDFALVLRKGRLDFRQRAKIMGIINLTPDSFSHDGIYRRFDRDYLDLVLKKAQTLVRDGADLLDLGGQSSRPGAKYVSIKEELRRTEPAVKFLVKKIKVPISVDTNKPEVAKAVLDAGAQIINDISGLRDSRMIKVVARFKAAVVIMHMLGKPVNMQKNIVYESLIEDIAGFLRKSIDAAQAGGILPGKIMIDPGLGFGKTAGQNLEIIKHLEEFKPLGKPILIGPSRKSFIAKVLKSDSENRTSGSIAACVMAVERGANIVRVHDVKEVKQALKIAESVLNNVNS